MLEIMQFDWGALAENLLRVAVAFLLSLPMAWERRKEGRGLGLRTFPVVAMAACGYGLIIKGIPDVTPEAQARVLQGILTGIGFIGGGAIVKKGGDVRGLVMAASVWNTGAIGAAVAFERAEVAVILSAINFVTLLLLTPMAEGRPGGGGGDRDTD